MRPHADSAGHVSQVLSAAEEHLANGRDDVAKKLFIEALEHPAGAARAMAGLGKIALRAGESETAQDLFGRALALEPDNATLLVGLAVVYQVSERLDDAATCLRRAMRLDPSLPDAPINLTLLLMQQQDVEGARAAAARAVEIAPNSTDAIGALAHVEMMSGNIPAAMSHFQRILALAPRDVNALTSSGTLSQLVGDPVQAAAYLEAARLQDPDAPQILARLAECRAALGQFEAAEKLVRQAAVLAPADAEVRNAEGSILLHRGRFAEAVTALQAAAELDPENPAPLTNLALLLRRSHEPEAALATARQARALSAEPNETARQLETDLLFLAGNWQEGWQSSSLLETPADMSVLQEAGTKLVAIAEDLPSALLCLRLLPQLADRPLRLLCLPYCASFFSAIPGIASVHPQQEIDLSKDIETGETAFLLDDLALLMRATPASLPTTALHLNLDDAPSPPFDEDGPRIGLWWDEVPGGPDPQVLIGALPGMPLLLRESEQNLVRSDGRAPQVLVANSAEELLDVAVALLAVDAVVTSDGPVAHLAANLGCRTLVICSSDIPWYWQPCGPDGARWYPTAQAVGRDRDGSWDTLAETCAKLVAEMLPAEAALRV